MYKMTASVNQREAQKMTNVIRKQMLCLINTFQAPVSCSVALQLITL